MYFLLNIHGYSSLCDSLVDQRVYPFQHFNKNKSASRLRLPATTCAPISPGCSLVDGCVLMRQDVESNCNGIRCSKLAGIPPNGLRRFVGCVCISHMGISKNRGTQNGWFIMENPIKMDDLGGTTILENTHVYHIYSHMLYVHRIYMYVTYTYLMVQSYPST